MRITRKILNLPPYISTSWQNVASLYVEERVDGQILIVELHNGSRVEIPGLDQALIEAIFETHTKVLEEEAPRALEPFPRREEMMPFRFGIGTGMDAVSAMHHNPEQKDAPQLPAEILTKIINVARVLGIFDPHTLPKPEPHCNCVHCQIARGLHGQIGHSENFDAEVKDDELKFRLWDIKQTAEKLYTVSNPSDSKEIYNVFLGDPIGCTCGQKNCEHIRAVLNS
ncbi:MAG TPA: hypothetical protein VLG44_04610 [Chlamydiales bacterium]|nr:hypothetical protein [Chlamydiales bacterium]